MQTEPTMTPERRDALARELANKYGENTLFAVREALKIACPDPTPSIHDEHREALAECWPTPGFVPAFPPHVLDAHIERFHRAKHCIPLNHPVLVEVMEAMEHVRTTISVAYQRERDMLNKAGAALRTLTEAAGTLPPQNPLDADVDRLLDVARRIDSSRNWRVRMPDGIQDDLADALAPFRKQEGE